MTDLSAGIRSRIDRYLGRVEEHLGSLSEEEREEILRDVEAHVHDALSRRTDGAATDGDLLAVLDEMDPPSSWGEAATAAAPAEGKPPPAPPPAGASADAPSSTPLSGRIPEIFATGAVLSILLAFFAAWSSESGAPGAAGVGLLAFGILAGCAGAMVLFRRTSPATEADPADRTRILSGVSFALLLATLAAVLGAVAARVSGPPPPFLYYDRKLDNLRLEHYFSARSVHEAAMVIALVFGSITLLLSWILGRIALAGQPEGWVRARARIAPALGSTTAILLLLVGGPLIAGASAYHHAVRNYGYHLRESQRLGTALGAGALALAIVILGLAIGNRAPPGKRLLSPATDCLRPGSARWLLLGALGVLLLGGAGTWLLWARIVRP